MKKLLGVVILGLLLSGNAYSVSIVEGLSKLNELYKSGALTDEEFSKAKLILLIESFEQGENNLKTNNKDLLDQNNIGALIDKSKEEEETAEIANIENSKLTLSEEDALKAQIFGCWTIPLGLPYDENLLVRIKLKIKPDGTISKVEILDLDRMNNPDQTFYRVLAESALRAVRMCQPLRVPSSGYERWKELQLNFDAREMLGG